MVVDYILRTLRELKNEGMESLGRYYSTYRAYVVDNKDPDGYNRLRVLVPILNPEVPLKVWAWPFNNFSGPGYGAQCLPQKNDVVWVSFEQGNPKAPVWAHGHFGKGDITEAKLKKPENFWFITPEGHRVELDDAEKHIRVKSLHGDIIELSDKITITSSKGDVVEMGNEIILTSSQGKVIHLDSKISLGSKGSSDEKAVLGDTLQNILDEILGLFDTLVGTPLATPAGPGTIASLLPVTITQVNLIKAKLQTIKSNTVTLDK